MRSDISSHGSSTTTFFGLPTSLEMAVPNAPPNPPAQAELDNHTGLVPEVQTLFRHYEIPYHIWGRLSGSGFMLCARDFLHSRSLLFTLAGPASQLVLQYVASVVEFRICTGTQRVVVVVVVGVVVVRTGAKRLVQCMKTCDGTSPLTCLTCAYPCLQV